MSANAEAAWAGLAAVVRTRVSRDVMARQARTAGRLFIGGLRYPRGMLGAEALRLPQSKSPHPGKKHGDIPITG
ncbi:hypothetical protein GCM10012284_18210 [Mangrovihabitans endophyticus]|uniref:Uncharacterized protein n=1 Tax=Mangrovihabitans endophyticus TaxID=1751298 RepID=A0A8J3BZE2_9ACTN|nr:hypothetical protein GCM10012284_18210 [Mangrovihabitans endophyticus]